MSLTIASVSVAIDFENAEIFSKIEKLGQILMKSQYKNTVTATV